MRTSNRSQTATAHQTETTTAAAANEKERRIIFYYIQNACFEFVMRMNYLFAAKLNESQYQNVNGNFFNESQRRAEQVEYHSHHHIFFFSHLCLAANVYLWFAVRYINKAARKKIKYNGTKTRIVYTHLHLSAPCFRFVSIWILNTIYADF